MEGFERLTIPIILYSILGMGGALISLWLSKFFAIKAMKVQLVSETDPQYADIVQKVHRLARKAGLSAKPEVGIYESSEINAFATGPSKKNSLVAVSTGLLSHMNEQEVEGVLAHEVSHIANGDMVTMSLLQGVINTMVYLLAYVLTEILLSRTRSQSRSWFLHYMVRQIFATLLFIPGSMLTASFSRFREYRADAGGARLSGRDKMLAALHSLSQISGTRTRAKQQSQYNYFMISNHEVKPWWVRAFSSHPPIQDRIRRLQLGTS